jgi:dTDP-4-dehydrorhamnose reductase
MWEEIRRVRPMFVVLSAGITGRPNIDWCETHPQETVAVNLEGTVTLAQICSRLNIRFTNFATGCIYTGGADQIFAESAPPNFVGSLYSRTKAHAEKIQVGAFGSNTLVLRLRMPIGEDIDHPRNLVAKLRNYARLINLPNSVSVMSELLPIAAHMIATHHTGLYNFTNPGHVTPADIMTAFDRAFPEKAKPWESVDDTAILFSTKSIVAPRSNCVLSCVRLYCYALANGIATPNTAKEAVRLLFERCKGEVPAGSE